MAGQVIPGSSVADAKLKPGDVIVAIKEALFQFVDSR